MSLAYLGTPYTRYKAGLRQAYVDAARLAAMSRRSQTKAGGLSLKCLYA